VKKRNPFFSPATITLFLLASLLAGCIMMPQISPVQGEEMETVLSYAEPLADNLFSGLNNGDYNTFSRDFDSEMKKAMKEKDFNDMANFFQQNIGKYQSRVVEKVEIVDNIYVVSYQARFENEEAVAVRLSVRGDSPPQVAGLWFDSPKLRE
jgi:hypothetical protein